MTLLKLGLRVWIALTSVFSFLVGWIMLAHSPKPALPTTSTSSSSASVAPDVSMTPFPTLAPLGPLNFSNGNNGFQGQSFSVQPVPQPQVIQPQTFSARPPRFATGGS